MMCIMHANFLVRKELTKPGVRSNTTTEISVKKTEITFENQEIWMLSHSEKLKHNFSNMHDNKCLAFVSRVYKN